jgi:hypothetical protein
MSAESLSAPIPGRAFSNRARRPGRRDLEGLAFGVATLLAAAVSAYALVKGHEFVAAVVSCLPVAGWFATRPAAPLVLLGLSLPALISLTGNGLGSTGNSGYNASISDFLLLLIGAGILFRWLAGRSEPVLRSLRVVAPPVLVYGSMMVIVLTLHPGLRELLKTGQRFELFLLPLIVGAFAALTGRHILVLRAYVLAATALAVVWPVHNLGLNKNPVGQLIANAILLLIGVRSLRRLWPCLALLVPGLLLTQSRGAIGGAAVGIMVILVLQRTRARPVLTRVLPVALLALGAFAVAPAALQSRVTTLHAGTSTPGQYALYLRQKYSQDAHELIVANPWTGVGIGNYYAADSRISTTPVLDPHNVLLLQEAEGGYLLGAAFVVLIAGTMLVLRRTRKVDVGPAAAGVLIATVAHGLVDVYWVRGTPLLGWLLVGMACGGLLKLGTQTRATRPS